MVRAFGLAGGEVHVGWGMPGSELREVVGE